MKITYTLIATLFVIPFFTSNIHADWLEGIDWYKSFGGSIGRSVQQTTDGGYIITGGYDDVYLIKTDSLGILQWSKTFGGTLADEGHSVQQTTDGGYIVAGSKTVNNQILAYLIKTNSSGNSEWERTYSSAFVGCVGHSVQQTSDGGYIITGFCGSQGGEHYAYLIKTDSSGYTQWTKTLTSGGWDESRSVQQTADGGYIIAGDVAVGALNTDAYLIKTDSSGNTQWSKTFGGPGWDTGSQVQITSDGGYIIAGAIDPSTAYYDFSEFYLVKTDSSGNSEWERIIETGSENAGASSVHQTSDGGYIIAGNAHEIGSAWTCQVMKTDSNGNKKWQRHFVFNGSTTTASYINQTSDSGYIFTGLADSGIFLVKLGPPQIFITSPNVGEYWVIGTGVTITWNSSFTVGDLVKIELYKNDSYLCDVITTVGNSGSYTDWSITSSLQPGNKYKVKILCIDNPSVYDFSDNYFNVTGSNITVCSPNGGESWQTGNEQDITWVSPATVGANVRIELYKNGSYLSDIITSTANDGTYMWQIPSDLPTDTTYKVKIIDTSNSSKYDYSDTYFSINNLPPGSLQFKSSLYSIDENAGNVRIYVSRTGGSYGIASVNYSTSNGTATAGSDYTANSGTLNWSNGDSADKYFDVSITNDSAYEGTETFTESLSDVIGASLGSPNQTTVVITDDDPPPYTIYPPVVETLSDINITSGTATLVGSLEFDGCVDVNLSCNCRFSYWKNGQQGNPKTSTWQSGISQGLIFSITISGLEPNSVYFFCAQASNSAFQARGDILSFRTFPDPNALPIVFEPSEPNMLLIQNFVKALQTDLNKPHNNQGLLAYCEKSGNSNGIDFNDVLYSTPKAKSSKIVSLIQVVNLQSQITDFNELSKDARPDNAQDSLLELSIYSPEPNESNINSENCLKFWLDPNAFKGKTVTIQKVSSDPNIIYPVWDVNAIISKNNRKLPLNNLVNQKLNAPYTWFTLSTSRQVLDLNGDVIVDLTDYAILQADVGKTGIFRSDIACMKGTVSVIGIPDGKVNAIDEVAFITEYNKKNPANPIPNPYTGLTEDFESGEIQEPFTTSGNLPWIISTDSHDGNYSVKSGDIGNSQNSVLEANVNAPTGKISFWRKVSSESGFDELIFYIDGVNKEKWSGFLDWEKMSFQVAPGSHTLRWEYKKDWTLSEGEDSAWIDDIVIQ